MRWDHAHHYEIDDENNDDRGMSSDSSSFVGTMVRPWVHHALVEVLKNAMVASVEKSKYDPPTMK